MVVYVKMRSIYINRLQNLKTMDLSIIFVPFMSQLSLKFKTLDIEKIKVERHYIHMHILLKLTSKQN